MRRIFVEQIENWMQQLPTADDKSKTNLIPTNKYCNHMELRLDFETNVIGN